MMSKKDLLKIEAWKATVESKISSIAMQLHNIKYGNLLEAIEERLDKLESDDRLFKAPHLEDLKILARIKHIQDRVEELASIVIPHFSERSKTHDNDNHK